MCLFYRTEKSLHASYVVAFVERFFPRPLKRPSVLLSIRQSVLRVIWPRVFILPQGLPIYGMLGRGGGCNSGVISVRVCEPVFWNQTQSYTWPLKKKQPIHILDFPASGNFFYLLLYFTNSLDQGQTGHDLDPNYLAQWWYFWKNYLKNVHLKMWRTKRFA